MDWQHRRNIVPIILEWYSKNGRTFPWREHSPDWYIVLLSETMLQQTQTSRVAEKLPIFLAQYPTIYQLAEADNATIIRSWQGMGYNSRALRLRDCAKIIVQNYNGVIPQTYEELRALPGVGDYTASALLAFAFRKDSIVIDVNIKRVLSRLAGGVQTTAQILSEEEIRSMNAALLPTGNASEWHQALMDIGALFCLARVPKCSQCPLLDSCPSAGNLREEKKVKRPEKMHRGQPSRIWRGRLVELLRGLPPEKTVSSEKALKTLFPQPTLYESAIAEEDKKWFDSTVLQLVKEQIVEYSDKQEIRLRSGR